MRRSAEPKRDDGQARRDNATAAARKPAADGARGVMTALQGAGNAAIVQLLGEQRSVGARGMITALQGTVGNAAVVRLPRGEHAASADGASGARQPVQRSAVKPAQPSAVKNVLSGAGQPLPEPLRAEMEARLGAEFSSVRVHSGPAAQRSAVDLGARAYTSGDHVVLGPGGADKLTLAHELAHVIQQRSGPVAGTDHGDGLRVSDPSDRFERAAEANAARVMAAPLPRQAAGTASAPSDPADAHARGGTPAHADGTYTGGHGHAATSEPVQRMTEDGEQARAPRRRVLVVSDVSGMGLGGVPVFNMELTKGLAVGHDVTMLTVDPAEDYNKEKKIEQHGGARVVNVPAKGTEPRDYFAELVKGKPGDDGPPPKPGDYKMPSEEDAFDVIIGHSRFSGPGAKLIRDKWYPKARLVHFLHTSPVRLDKIKRQPEKGGQKSKAEREVMRDADLVAGVGPLLTAEAERLSRQILRVPAVHEFVPGTEAAEPVRPSLWNRTKHALHLPAKLKLLLPGRAADEIKGVKAAIMAVGILRGKKSEGGYGLDVRLTVRGAPDPAEKPKEYQEWKDIADQYGKGGITLLPFTTNPADLESNREKTHALIMPSLHEGFGLVATEAASQSIPVLVNGESGAAQFLKHFRQLGVPMVVDAPFTIDPVSGNEVAGGEAQRAQVWARAIATLNKELLGRRALAESLRSSLSQYTWQHAAEALIAAAMTTTISGPDRYGMRHGYGASTRQGAGGVVETVDAKRRDWTPTAFWEGSTPEPSNEPLAYDPFADILRTLDLALP